MGSIGWLAQSIRPYLAPPHSFLSTYNSKPSRSHLNAALYVLHYIHSTIDYGFTFLSKATVPFHLYILFPRCSDTKAYNDAVPTKDGSCHRLTTYSNACRYILFPHRFDTKAYNDAVPTKDGNCHCLTTYSNACWGSQLGNAI